MKKTLLHRFKMPLRLLAASLLLGLSVPPGQAADVFGPARTVDYQGQLLDGNGALMAPTTPTNYQVQFRLYDAQSGGTLVWAESQLVTVSKGKFSVRLGEGTAILGVGGADIGAVDHDTVGLPGAFNGNERFLGITVVIPGQTPGEISPRLAFLTSPFSFVAGRAQSADSVNQSSTSPPSSLNVGAISYATNVMTASGTIALTAQTILGNATAAAVAATLPAGTAALNRQYLVTKTDASANPIVISPPSGGTINASAASISLTTQGESVTLQNIGANSWWIVADTRVKPGVPAGTIIAFGGALANIPAGYLLCNGASLNRVDQPTLFAAIGTGWGTASGTTFNLPDLRGRFPRGVDGGTARDEDAASRSLAATGGNSGNNVGTVQVEQFRSHAHGVSDPGHVHSKLIYNGNNSFSYIPGVNSLSVPSTNTTTDNTNVSYTNISIQANGGNETRPDNAAVYYLIKF